MTAYVYIVKCSDNTLYTGWTTCLIKRLKMHNNGKASKYTRVRLPVEIIFWEQHETKENALKREREIKSFSRAEKLELCNNKQAFL